MSKAKMSPPQNKVWIEMQPPRDAAHAAEICQLANNMTARLSDGAETRVFSWNDERKQYEFGNDMGYEGLSDRDKWFNLDFCGRPLEEAPALQLVRQLAAGPDSSECATGPATLEDFRRAARGLVGESVPA